MKLNKKGVLPFCVLASYITFAGIVGVTTSGIIETSKNGILKRNGQTIWCKMQNKGANFCNEKYGYK